MVVQNGVLNDSRVLKTAQSVRKLGYQVTLFGCHSKREIKVIDYSTITIKLLPNPSIKLRDEGTWISDINERNHSDYDRVAAEQLMPFIKETAPDILHTHDMIGLAIGASLAAANSLKDTRWIHDLHEYVRGVNIAPKMQAHYEGVETKAIGWPDALTTVSPPLAALLKKDHELARPPDLVLNAPRRCDFDPHYPKTVRSDIGLDAETPLMVYSGGVKAIRGVDMIVDALPMRPDRHLAVVSSSKGPDVDALQESVATLDASARYHRLPFVPFMNVTSYLRGATVGIHPIRRYPNAEIALPNKLFEYVHAGLPVVTSDNPTMKAFVEQEQCGTTFPLEDPVKLSDKVDEALDLASAQDFKQRLDDIARRYCWEEQEKTLAEIYDRVDPAAGGDVAVASRSRQAHRSSPRVLQLPTTQAGPIDSLVEGLRLEGVKASSLNTGPNAFGQGADIAIEHDQHGVEHTPALVRGLGRDYDVFHFHDRPLRFKPTCPFGTGFDLLALRLMGRKVFFHCSGSEMRTASTFRRHSPYHYVDDNPDDLFGFNEACRRRPYRDYLEAVCNGVFVSDPELLTYVPHAIMVPRALDLKAWHNIGIHNPARPKIVHASSNRTIKGTDAILAVIDRLKSDGRDFTFEMVEGVAHDEARKVYESADIVIDQLRSGWYGALGVEAMALGKVVITYIRDDLRHYLPDPPPLCSANPDNLYDVLSNLLNDHLEMEQLGKRARAYAEEVHDARKIARFLTTVYDMLEGSIGDATRFQDFIALQRDAVRVVPPKDSVSMRKATTRIRRWIRHFQPRHHVSLFVGTWRREGTEQAMKRTLDFLRCR